MQKFHIKNFRGISDLAITFNQGLNIVIGENNVCKTAIIDALRICFGYGKQQRDIWVNPDDFYVNEKEIWFDLTFTDISETEQGVFIDMLVPDSPPVLKLHIRYTIDKKNLRIKPQCWGGPHEGQDITQELFGLFDAVALGALRDVERDLYPKKGSKLGRLLLKMVPEEKQQKSLAIQLDAALASCEWQNVMKDAKTTINSHLNETAMGVFKQQIELDFLPHDFTKITDALKIFVTAVPIKRERVSQQFSPEDTSWQIFFEEPESSFLYFKDNFIAELENSPIDAKKKKILKDCFKETLFELTQNGLGYNNLIYMATVVGDLIKRKEVDSHEYLALLIEEPEAHLHPQVQNILLKSLKSWAAKKIQIFISSHSPTITAKSGLDELIVVDRERMTMSATNLLPSELSTEDKKYLERFIDVTKSQMFFSKRIILVEGISEALLVPVFADKLGRPIENAGIELVNINGVAFRPFINLLKHLTPLKKCSIITDNDSDSSRVQKLLGLIAGIPNIDAFLAHETFETELFKIPENKQIIFEIYTDMHPQTAGLTLSMKNETFTAIVNSNKDKAELAQRLAYVLSTDVNKKNTFVVPDYINKALEYVRP